MEFAEVVRARRMVRRYDPHRGVPRETVTRLLDLAVQAPSAGFSQGWGFLVLDTRNDLDRYWDLTARPADPAAAAGAEDSWLTGMRTAPVLLLALSDPQAYAQRYARADKARSPLSTAPRSGSDAVSGGMQGGMPGGMPGGEPWPVPWWDVDTGMAALLVLLGATDLGLGGCLAGVPSAPWERVRRAFGIPSRLRPVGIVTLGHPAPGAEGGRGRTRRPTDDVVRRGRWTP